MRELGLLVRACAGEVRALFADADARACATLLVMQLVVSGPSWRAAPVQRLVVLLALCTGSRIAFLARRLRERLA